MFNPKGTTDEEIRQERIKYLEKLMKERGVKEWYIQQVMSEYGFPRDIAMMAILGGA